MMQAGGPRLSAYEFQHDARIDIPTQSMQHVSRALQMQAIRAQMYAGCGLMQAPRIHVDT